MPRRMMLSVFAVLVTVATAGAADLPTQSRLGRIFAEPAQARAEVEVVRAREISGPVIPYSNLPDPVWNRGAPITARPGPIIMAGPITAGLPRRASSACPMSAASTAIASRTPPSHRYSSGVWDET